MANEKSGSGSAVATDNAGSKMTAARNARKPRDPNAPKLSPEASFVLRAVTQAKSACSLLAKRLRNGGTISGEAAKACTTLSGEYATLIGE